MSKGGNPEGTNSMQLGPRKSFINSFKCTRSQHLPCPYPLLYSPLLLPSLENRIHLTETMLKGQEK